MNGRIVDEEGFSLELKRLLATVEEGNKAREFLDSDIGSYLLAKAGQAEVSAFQEFLEVDPTDAMAIRDIQERGRSPKVMFSFLRDALENGQQAQESVNALKESDNGY